MIVFIAINFKRKILIAKLSSDAKIVDYIYFK